MITVNSYVASHVALLQGNSFLHCGEVEVTIQVYIDFLNRPIFCNTRFTYTRFQQEEMLMVHYEGGYDQIYGSNEDLEKIIASVSWYSRPLSFSL
jgi:hypothetical protein